MRLSYMIFSFATGGSTIAQGVVSTSALDQLPNCAQTCLVTAISASPCQFTDTTCICTNTELQSVVDACVLQSCTVRQILTTRNVTMSLCHVPGRSDATANDIKGLNIALAVLTAIFGIARIIYQAFFSAGELGWDDYSLMSALLAGLPSVIVIDRCIVPNGLGQDVWTVPFDHITNFIRSLYGLAILYLLQIMLIKLTLLFFFLRIFPRPVIRQLLWATVAFNCFWGLTFMTTSIFSCQPISFYWTSWDQSGSGKCVNINALTWANAAISIALDVWMLALPLYEVFRLQLTMRKKLSVTLMFVVGTFVTIISILRLQSLVHFAASDNPTGTQTEVIKWSTIEINVGIICACMPSLRVMLVHVFPKMLGSTDRVTELYEIKYGNGTQSVLGAGLSPPRITLGRSKSTTSGPIEIRCTTTYTVQHSQSDETSLVHLEEIESKRPHSRCESTDEISF